MAAPGHPRLTVALMCAALLAGAAGCGGGGGEDDAGSEPAATPTQPTPADVSQGGAVAALQSFLGALVDGDAAAACELLSARGRSIVEEGALIGSPEGGGACEDVIIRSYGSPEADVVRGFEVVGRQPSGDGSLRLQWRNADTAITGAAAAVLRREGGAWRVDSTGLPRG